ncbi:MAG TPA: ATPase domain-containing protein, partial [Chloroflexaceae bacterium]|nr:ATPase domain-containing protein [Chloroflexaceae bacterium]
MTQPTELSPIPRVPTGIAGLDAILSGGLLAGGLYIILGNPGAGKTIMANQIAFSYVATGGKVAYLTLLAETHARMLAHLQMMRFFDPQPVSQGLLYVSAYRTLKDGGLRGLLQFVREVVREQRATLLVIDGLITAEEFSGSEIDYKQFIHELHTFLEAVDCTSLLLSQDSRGAETAAAHTMVDGLIELRDSAVGIRSVRELRVRKFRGSAHLRGQHMFEISDEGITVHPRTEVAHTRSPVPILAEPRVPFGVPGLDEMLRGGVLPRT